jgi:hypothetical protein
MSYACHSQIDRRWTIALAVLVTTIAALAGCGGGDSTSPGGGGGKSDVWSVVAQRSWHITGETEGFVCNTEQVTSDEYFTGFRLASPPSAQAEVYLMLHGTASKTGDFDCSPGSAFGEMIYAAGPGTNAITFPEGKGVRVPAGEYVALVIHMHNTADSTVAVTTTIEGRVGTAADVTTPINVFLAGTVQINIPPDATAHTAAGGCNTFTEQDFVEMMPMMRALGVHQKVEIIASDTTTILDTDFDPSHMLYTPLSPDAIFPNGSRLQVTCTYVNNTGTAVGYNEYSYGESCFTAIYHSPSSAISSNAPYDCVTGFFDRVGPGAFDASKHRTG